MKHFSKKRLLGMVVMVAALVACMSVTAFATADSQTVKTALKNANTVWFMGTNDTTPFDGNFVERCNVTKGETDDTNGVTKYLCREGTEVEYTVTVKSTDKGYVATSVYIGNDPTDELPHVTLATGIFCSNEHDNYAYDPVAEEGNATIMPRLDDYYSYASNDSRFGDHCHRIQAGYNGNLNKIMVFGWNVKSTLENANNFYMGAYVVKWSDLFDYTNKPTKTGVKDAANKLENKALDSFVAFKVDNLAEFDNAAGIDFSATVTGIEDHEDTTIAALPFFIVNLTDKTSDIHFVESSSLSATYNQVFRAMWY